MYKLPRNEQFIFTNIAQTNKLWLPIDLTNSEPLTYEHFNKLTLTNLMIYLMKRTDSTWKHISKNTLCS
jgi:hypothetical protein